MFTHIDKNGRPHMVDVSEKDITNRIAVAKGSIYMKKETLALIKEGQVKKGDVLSAAQVAGIMAAKKTAELIPMCHNIFITGISMEFDLDFENNAILVSANCRTASQTGIEMEALTAVSVSLLTIYDMCKSYDREMVIKEVMLTYKEGGKSGVFEREGE